MFRDQLYWKYGACGTLLESKEEHFLFEAKEIPKRIHKVKEDNLLFVKWMDNRMCLTIHKAYDRAYFA